MMALTSISFVRRISLIAIVLLAVSASFCPAQELPSGWRYPSAKQATQDFRLQDRNRFLGATGDFNGDGVQDKALLLVNDKTSKLGLFVCLTTAQGCDWHRLEEMDLPFIEVMGIATVKPGKYQTACGKGYWNCEKNEPKFLVLKNQAIELFKDESASSYYVYDPRKNDFMAIGISD
jgi:hypothetical protein